MHGATPPFKNLKTLAKWKRFSCTAETKTRAWSNKPAKTPSPPVERGGGLGGREVSRGVRARVLSSGAPGRAAPPGARGQVGRRRSARATAPCSHSDPERGPSRTHPPWRHRLRAPQQVGRLRWRTFSVFFFFFFFPSSTFLFCLSNDGWWCFWNKSGFAIILVDGVFEMEIVLESWESLWSDVWCSLCRCSNFWRFWKFSVRLIQVEDCAYFFFSLAKPGSNYAWKGFFFSPIHYLFRAFDFYVLVLTWINFLFVLRA